MFKRCCFAGHREICDATVFDRLTALLKKLIEEENVKEFWVGHYGDFDGMAANAVRQLKEKDPTIRLELVLPYLTTEVTDRKQYFSQNFDTLLMAEIPENTPKRFRIIKANEYMVNHCDILVSYVKNSWGGAAKTEAYARRKGRIIYALGEI